MYLTYIYNEATQINAIKLLEYMYGQRETYTSIEHVPYSKNYQATRTMVVNAIDNHPYNVDGMINALTLLSTTCVSFLNTLVEKDTSQCYEMFQIPKHSGGMRTIHAPNLQIAELQRQITHVFKYDLHVLSHNNAFAYVEGRGTKDALIRHKNNKSKWFLKLDLKDFFPNCTKDFILKQLKKLYPFHYFDNSLLEPIIDVCLLDGGLPQGAPTSPMITNLIMLPIDYELNKRLYNFNKSHYCVTRYADDILISNQYGFKYTDVVDVVKEILLENEAGFQLNNSKTRYASNAGRNWNLGLMYNTKGDITVGHKRKKKVKNLLYYFFRDNHEQRTWSLAECQQVIGELAYVQQIEPTALADHLSKLETRYNVPWHVLRKRVLKD